MKYDVNYECMLLNDECYCYFGSIIDYSPILIVLIPFNS